MGMTRVTPVCVWVWVGGTCELEDLAEQRMAGFAFRLVGPELNCSV